MLIKDTGPVPHANGEEIARNFIEHFEYDHNLNDPTLRRDYFEHLEEPDFVGLVQQVANGVRGKPLNHYQPFDGQNVRLALIDIPDFDEREGLVKDVWHGVRSILADTSLPDKEALTYGSLLAGLGVVMIHPFADGNGRVTRTITRLINEGTENQLEQDMVKILESGWDNYYQIGIGSRGLEHYMEQASPLSDFNPYKRDVEAVESIKFAPDSYSNSIINATDDKSGFGVVEGLVHAQLDDRVARQFMTLIDEPGWSVISKHITNGDLALGEALQELSLGDHGIKYMAQLHDIEKKTRSEYIRRLIVTMTSKEKVSLDEHADWNVKSGGSTESEKEFSRQLKKVSEIEGAAYGGRLQSVRERLRPFKRRSTPEPQKRVIAPRDTLAAHHRAYSKKYRDK